MLAKPFVTDFEATVILLPSNQHNLTRLASISYLVHITYLCGSKYCIALGIEEC